MKVADGVFHSAARVVKPVQAVTAVRDVPVIEIEVMEHSGAYQRAFVGVQMKGAVEATTEPRYRFAMPERGDRAVLDIPPHLKDRRVFPEVL